jgi:type IV pilus assembly protein PilC
MQFLCRYGTPDGRILTKVQQGSDADAVRKELERQGFHIFEIRQRGFLFEMRLPFMGPPSGHRRMPLDQFLAFNQELAALLRAGLPILQGLGLMLERIEDPHTRQVLTEIHDQIKSGSELSDAFASFGNMFPPLYAATLKAGERSGELESVIRRYIRYLKLVSNSRKKATSALVYPAVLITLSIGMLAILAIYVVPSFSQFYEDLDAELPALTQFTLTISFFLRDNILWILASLFVIVIGLRNWTATPNGRLFVDRLRLRIPLLGSISLFFSLSEFCRALATLLSGGIPLVTALDTAVSAVGNSYIRKAVAPVIGNVSQGEAFNESLEETAVFPHIAIDMIKVGEATGSLDEMLSSVADYFDENIETKVERLLTLVEPVMLVGMGFLVAMILVSIYLPMFGAFSQVGN